MEKFIHSLELYINTETVYSGKLTFARGLHNNYFVVSKLVADINFMKLIEVYSFNRYFNYTISEFDFGLKFTFDKQLENE